MAEQKVQQKSEQQYQPNQHQLINNCFIGRNTKIWNFKGEFFRT